MYERRLRPVENIHKAVVLWVSGEIRAGGGALIKTGP